MMGLDNPLHLVFLLAILLLVFGAKRLPEIGRSLGAGLRGFKESITAPGPAEAPAPAVPAAAPAVARRVAPAPAESALARRVD
jgi:sec-independent protein translocase protein TatA